MSIIAIGAASQDVYLQGETISAVCNPETKECAEQFPLGAKLEVDRITFGTGGGASNAAVTFARAGLHAAFAGKLGHDSAATNIIHALAEDNVDTSRVVYHQSLGTQYSTILLNGDGERTILIYRGAAHTHEISDYPEAHLHAQWLYVTSLAGNMEVLEYLVNTAHKLGMKIAMNPGNDELEQADRMKMLLPKIDVLSLNKEEMQKLYQGESMEDLARAAHEIPYVVITDGPNGVVARDHEALYKAGIYEDVPVVDRLGAGDAFSSGFVAMIARGESTEKALTYASANSTSVVGVVGAKPGIIRLDTQLHDMPIERIAL